MTVVRYAVVGAGDIAQENFMPGVKHTGNSILTAVITGDKDKAQELAKMYDLKGIYSYDEYDSAIASGLFDAVYVATPNWLHTEYVVKALRAGIHVLLEKPMAITSDDCHEMIAAGKASGAKLMVAYRLHFEPGTVAAIAAAHSDSLGRVQVFTSTFGQDVKSDNHRKTSGFEGGPVYDMGPYPINASRNLFGAEPIEVSATGVRHKDDGYVDFDDTVSITLTFPGNRVATFVVSYSTNKTDEYTLVGDKGTLRSSPAFMFRDPVKHFVTRDGKEDVKTFPQTDHFGGETKYFSDCILSGNDPEPDGEEGWLDVRVIEAVRRSLETGQPQKLAPYTRTKRVDESQVVNLRPVKSPELVKVSSPGK